MEKKIGDRIWFYDRRTGEPAYGEIKDMTDGKAVVERYELHTVPIDSLFDTKDAVYAAEGVDTGKWINENPDRLKHLLLVYKEGHKIYTVLTFRWVDGRIHISEIETEADGSEHFIGSTIMEKEDLAKTLAYVFGCKKVFPGWNLTGNGFYLTHL